MKKTICVQLCATLVGVAVGVAGVSGCGGDAHLGVSEPTPQGPPAAKVHGTVQMPNGQVATGPGSPLQRLAAALLPEAAALTANVSSVGAGVQVQLTLYHANGSPDSRPAASASTDGQGQYAIGIPSPNGPDTCRYVVSVGAGSTLTRAFVTTTDNANDIDYATEAAVHLVLDQVGQGDNLCRFTSSELDMVVTTIRNIDGDVSGANAAEVNANAYERAVNHVPPILPPIPNTPTPRPTNTPRGQQSTATATVPVNPSNTPTTPPVVPTTPPVVPTTPPVVPTTPPVVPTNTFTPTTTMPTPTQIPCNGPAIQIDVVSATPGTQVTITATLHSGTAMVAGTQNDFSFDALAPVNFKAGNRPDCAVNPDIGKDASSFAFRPNGCSGTACTAVRALVLSTSDVNIIPDGSVLYTCKVNVDATANSTYPLPVSGLVLSNDNGDKIPNVSGCDGAIIAGPVPRATQTFTAAPTPSVTPTFTEAPATPTPTPPGATPIPSPTPTDTVPPLPTATATNTVPPANTATPTITDTPGGPSPIPTATATDTPVAPTFVPLPCIFSSTTMTGATISVRGTLQLLLSLPLTGSQIWRFGPPEADLTRKIAILPSESHFDCVEAAALTLTVKVCARLDAAGGTGVVDCAAAGGDIPNFDSLVQIDHNTNNFAGPPPTPPKTNIGFPADPNCTATYPGPDGSVLQSCLEGTDSGCTGTAHNHPGVCNSPAVPTLSGASTAGGFKLHEAIDLSFAIGKHCADKTCFCAVGTCSAGPTPGAQCFSNDDCGSGGTCSADATNGKACTTSADCTGFTGQVTPGVCGSCPPDTCPQQAGELQIAGDITSGHTKGVIWNLNNSQLTMGTTGAGNGIPKFCGGKDCITEATGTPINLTSIGNSCTESLPANLSGATVALAYPAIDLDPTIGDVIATLKLQCQ